MTHRSKEFRRQMVHHTQNTYYIIILINFMSDYNNRMDKLSVIFLCTMLSNKTLNV